MLLSFKDWAFCFCNSVYKLDFINSFLERIDIVTTLIYYKRALYVYAKYHSFNKTTGKYKSDLNLYHKPNFVFFAL